MQIRNIINILIDHFSISKKTSKKIFNIIENSKHDDPEELSRKLTDYLNNDIPQEDKDTFLMNQGLIFANALFAEGQGVLKKETDNVITISRKDIRDTKDVNVIDMFSLQTIYNTNFLNHMVSTDHLTKAYMVITQLLSLHNADILSYDMCLKWIAEYARTNKISPNELHHAALTLINHLKEVGKLVGASHEGELH